MEIKQTLKGYVFVVLSAIIYGLMPMMTKFIYGEGVSTLCLVFLRNALALPLLALLALWDKKTLKITPKALPSIALISLLGLAVTPLLLFYSYRFIASGTATVFHFIYPAMVVLMGVIFFRRKAEKEKVISALVCLAGVCLFYDPGATLDLRGSAAALASGCTFALYVILLSYFKHKEISGFLLNFYVSLVSTVALGIVLICSGEFAFPSSLFGWCLTTVFALSVTVGAVGLFQQGTFLVGPEKASVLSTMELMTGVITGILVFHEAFNLRTAIGAVLVFLAGLLIAVFDLKKAKKESDPK